MKSKDVDKSIKLTIVIVDDNPDEHFFIKNALREFKNIFYNDYFNGEDFLHFLEEKSKTEHSNLYPDIVILDVNMPKMTGFEVFDLIEKNGLKDHMRFYILTSGVTEKEISNCEKYKLKCYQKPFNIDYFAELLEEILLDYTSK